MYNSQVLRSTLVRASVLQSCVVTRKTIDFKLELCLNKTT